MVLEDACDSKNSIRKKGNRKPPHKCFKTIFLIFIQDIRKMKVSEFVSKYLYVNPVKKYVM